MRYFLLAMFISTLSGFSAAWFQSGHQTVDYLQRAQPLIKPSPQLPFNQHRLLVIPKRQNKSDQPRHQQIDASGLHNLLKPTPEPPFSIEAEEEKQLRTINRDDQLSFPFEDDPFPASGHMSAFESPQPERPAYSDINANITPNKTTNGYKPTFQIHELSGQSSENSANNNQASTTATTSVSSSPQQSGTFPEQTPVPQTDQQHSEKDKYLQQLAMLRSKVDKEGIFFLDFDKSKSNTRKTAEIIEELALLLRVLLPEEEQNTLVCLFKEINQCIHSIQRHEIPERSPNSLVIYSLLTKIHSRNKNQASSEVITFTNIIFAAVTNMLRTDYFMFGQVDRNLCGDIASMAQLAGETKVLELMAGAGWLQKGLTEAGLDVDACDDFSITRHDSYLDPRGADKMKELFGTVDHMTDLKIIPGAKVRQQDAMEALTQSPRKIVVLNWPEPDPELIRTILEHCYQTRKMIVYIEPDFETIEQIACKPDEPEGQCSFVELPETPISWIKGQRLRVGFWKEIPQWYENQKNYDRYQFYRYPFLNPEPAPSKAPLMAFTLSATVGVLLLSYRFRSLHGLFGKFRAGFRSR